MSMGARIGLVVMVLLLVGVIVAYHMWLDRLTSIRRRRDIRAAQPGTARRPSD
jgi:hypothetical protein